MWTDNPILDYERYADEQQEALERCPICEICGEYIQDEHYYEINDEAVCQECLDNEYKRRTEDYMEYAHGA